MIIRDENCLIIQELAGRRCLRSVVIQSNLNRQRTLVVLTDGVELNLDVRIGGYDLFVEMFLRAVE